MTGQAGKPRQVSLEDRVVTYCEWGDPAGRPVFFLHGAPGSRMLRHVGRDGSDVLYADQGLRVITLDRPGYGSSTRRPGRRVVDAADDVAAVADAVGLDRFGVVGVSAGASAALATAAVLASRVQRCGLIVAPAPLRAADLDYFAGASDDARQQWAFADLEGQALEEWLARDWTETEHFVRTVVPTLELPPAELQMLREAFEEGIRPGPGGLHDDLLALAAPWGFAVEDVTAPVHLLQAEEDEGIPSGHAAWYLAHLQDAQVTWVPGGHISQRLEEELALLRWAAAVPGRAQGTSVPASR